MPKPKVKVHRPPRFLVAALSGALVVLSFPRYGYEVGLDGLAWICLVPLLSVATGAGVRRGFCLGAACGATLEGAGFIWILLAIRRFTDLPAPVASIIFLLWLLYAMVPWALLGAALGKCSRPGAVLWVLPLWTGLEHIFPRIFPWHLGGALYGREWIVQCADLLGTSGLTALVFLSNAVLFLVWSHLREECAFPLKSIATFVVLLIGGIFYGVIRLKEVEDMEAKAPRLGVLLVQGCLDPFDKKEDGLARYLGLTRQALAERRPELVVWPEGADHFRFDLTPGNDPWVYHRADANARPFHLDDILGVPAVVGGWGVNSQRTPESSNIAAYLSPGAPPRFYEKNVRLIFGEYVPLLDLLPRSWFVALGLHVGTIAAGKENPLLRLGERAFRTLICYEAVLPETIRRASEESDFLVNITEDIWYGRTAHITQHASVLSLRVIENRTPLVRATNVGPSGVIDITGRFRHGSKVFEPEVVRAELKAQSLSTIYRAGGYLFPWLCLLLAGARVTWMYTRARRAATVPGPR